MNIPIVKNFINCSLVLICFYLVSCAASLSRNFELGNQAFKNGNYDEAIDYFTSYLNKSPEDADARLKLGMAYLREENLKEAVNHFKQSIKLDPENEQARTLIKESIFEESHRFAEQGDEITSMRYLTAYLTINPDDVDTNLALAKVFVKRGNRRNALGCLKKLVALDPRNPEVIKLIDYFADGFH